MQKVVCKGHVPCLLTLPVPIPVALERMGVTCLTVKAAAPAGVSTLPTPELFDTSTQTELCKGEVAV